LAEFSYYLERVLNTLPEREDRPFLNFAVEEAEEKKILVVEAPTGYGKSLISQTIALRSLQEGLKCLVAFPLRTLLEDQLFKFRMVLERLGFDKESVGARYMHYPESRYLIRPITLTTVDTLSLTLFGIAPEDLEVAFKHYDGTLTGSMGHYLFSRAMVLLSDIVLDEVHLLADTTKSLNFLVALIWIIASHGGRGVFLSATIPNAFEKILRKECSEVGLDFARFSGKPDENFLEERRRKRYKVVLERLGGDKFEKIFSWLKEGMRDGFRRSVVVFNTAHEAIEFYKMVKNNLGIPSDKILLLHSRFAAKDREAKMMKVEKLKESREYLIISTQVVEAGVDISSDLFISDLAPAASLIQRAGRFLRYKGENEGMIYLWYENEDGEKYKGIYDATLLERTLSFLNNKDVRFHDPESYQHLLDSVYTEDTFRLDPHQIRRLISLSNTLENTDEVIRTFIQLEGSFVRDETIVPAIPHSLPYENISPIEAFAVPLSLSTIVKLRPKEVLVKRDEGYQKDSAEVVWSTRRRDIWRQIFSPKFVAFVVEGEYDEELGLRWEHEKGSQLL